MPRKSPQGEIAAILNTKHHRIGPRPDCPPEVAEIFRELTSAVAPALGESPQISRGALSTAQARPTTKVRPQGCRDLHPQ
jgi:hypothetical protein